MNAYILELTRAEVAECKRICRESFDVSAWEPMLSICGCWNYHQAVMKLHDAQERLRNLERNL